MRTIAPPYKANREEPRYPEGWEDQGAVMERRPGDRVVAYMDGEWQEAEVMSIRRMSTVVDQWALILRPRDRNRSRRFEAVVTADGHGPFVRGLA